MTNETPTMGSSGGAEAPGPERRDPGAAPPAPGDEPRGEPPLPSLPRRVVQVFLSPGELFDALARTPAWVGALLLGMALVAVGGLLIPQELYVEMMEGQVQAQGGPAEGAPSPETMARFAKIFGAVFGGLAWALIIALWAGAATVLFGFLMDDEGTFKQYLAATSHALLIAAVGSLILIPLRIVQGDVAATLSLGTFVEGFLDEGYALRVLRGLDLFTLWAVLVLAVGVARLGRRRSWGSAAAVLVAIWVGLAAVFGIFSFGQGA